jgi:hypothetical protein
MARSFLIASNNNIDCTRIAPMENVANLSMTFWMKKATGKRVSLGKCIATTAANAWFWYWNADNKIYFGSRYSGSAFGRIDGFSTFDTFVHVAMVFYGAGATSQDKLTIYLNGAYTATTAYSAAVQATTTTHTGSFKIGTVGDFASLESEGTIGNVRLYLAALSQGQVYTDMCGFLPIAPLANWPLGMSSPEVDLSGNGYAGTLVNAPAIADGPPVCIPNMFESEYYGGVSQINAPRAYYRNLLMRAA